MTTRMVAAWSCLWTMILFAPLGFAATPVAPVILQPAGGELFVIGSSQRVVLDAKTRAKSLTVELSIDGGTTFTALGTINNTVKDKAQRNRLTFTVPNSPSGNCMVRVTGDGGASSLSAGFSIASAASVSGTAPLSFTQITSGTATTGQVLTSDGSGGTAFTAVGTSGITSGTATTGQVLTSDGSGGTAFTAVGTSGLTSGSASTGQVLTANGTGGTSYTSLEGKFVRVAGDSMTGALNVAGDVGIGTTTPRGQLEVSKAGGASMVLSGDANRRYEWSATPTQFLLTEFEGLNSKQHLRFTANGDIDLGGPSNGRILLQSGGSVDINGALSIPTRTQTTSTTANNASCVFFCNTATSNITVTLPATSGISGRIYIFKKTSANNSLTIATTGANTIDGAATLVLNANNEFRTVISSGANWFVIGQ